MFWHEKIDTSKTLYLLLENHKELKEKKEVLRKIEFFAKGHQESGYQDISLISKNINKKHKSLTLGGSYLLQQNNETLKKKKKIAENI